MNIIRQIIDALDITLKFLCGPQFSVLGMSLWGGHTVFLNLLTRELSKWKSYPALELFTLWVEKVTKQAMTASVKAGTS